MSFDQMKRNTAPKGSIKKMDDGDSQDTFYNGEE